MRIWQAKDVQFILFKLQYQDTLNLLKKYMK